MPPANQRDSDPVFVDRPLPVAVELKALLEKKRQHIVFAESCTCGLVAALLGQVAGVSSWLCGSAVTYQAEVKKQWLDVGASTLEAFSAESIETTMELAEGVLRKTPQAEIAIAVTGHLGPGAPAESDGRVFLAMHCRTERDPNIVTDEQRLASTDRISRQLEAAQLVLQFACRCLEG